MTKLPSSRAFIVTSLRRKINHFPFLLFLSFDTPSKAYQLRYQSVVEGWTLSLLSSKHVSSLFQEDFYNRGLGGQLFVIFFRSLEEALGAFRNKAMEQLFEHFPPLFASYRGQWLDIEDIKPLRVEEKSHIIGVVNALRHPLGHLCTLIQVLGKKGL